MVYMYITSTQHDTRDERRSRKIAPNGKEIKLIIEYFSNCCIEKKKSEQKRVSNKSKLIGS